MLMSYILDSCTLHMIVIPGFEHNVDMYEEPLLTDKKTKRQTDDLCPTEQHLARPTLLWSYETVTIRIRNNSE